MKVHELKFCAYRGNCSKPGPERNRASKAREKTHPSAGAVAARIADPKALAELSHIACAIRKTTGHASRVDRGGIDMKFSRYSPYTYHMQQSRSYVYSVSGELSLILNPPQNPPNSFRIARCCLSRL